MKITDNMELYNKYRQVPNNALKDFDNGKFKGTDINTMWRIKSLTEQFGPCGFGWYFTTKRLWVEETKNGEQFAFADIELFVKYNGEWSKPISGNGGNKLLRLTKKNEPSTSDEAFKMAVTDAIGVACRNLGFGADIYWANDKTKYTEYTTKKGKKTEYNEHAYKTVTEIIPTDDERELPWNDDTIDHNVLNEIYYIAQKAKVTNEQLILGCRLHYQKERPEDLNTEEANDLIKRLQSRIGG